MKRIFSGIALILIASCGESTPPAPPAAAAKATEAKVPPPSAETVKKKTYVDKKGRSKSPEIFQKYREVMEANGDLLQSIEEDVEKGKGDAVIRPKVAKLIKNGEAARALHYRKDPDEDKELDVDFELFLDKMKIIERETWDADSGKGLFERVSGRCTICHDKFQ
jgi:hypothetical protein